MSSKPHLRYLALGDSYTIGHNVEVEERWPVQLVDRLRAEGVDVAYPEIIAVSGWTTSQLAEGIDAGDPQGPFDVVSLMIGVNNQYHGLDIGEYREEFVDLLRRSIAFAGDAPSSVIAISIPDWSVTPFAKGKDRPEAPREIEQFNAVNQEEAAKCGARYVSVTEVSQLAAEEAELLSSDGLHPSGLMYNRWVDLILPAFRSAIGL